jgi:hypothetical protein
LLDASLVYCLRNMTAEGSLRAVQWEIGSSRPYHDEVQMAKVASAWRCRAVLFALSAETRRADWAFAGDMKLGLTSQYVPVSCSRCETHRGSASRYGIK